MLNRTRQLKTFTTVFHSLSNVLSTDVKISRAVAPTGEVGSSKKVEVISIWDTGATNSVITPKVVAECELFVTGQTQVIDASGPKISNVYKVNIELPNDVLISNLSVTEGNFAGGIS